MDRVECTDKRDKVRYIGFGQDEIESNCPGNTGW